MVVGPRGISVPDQLAEMRRNLEALSRRTPYVNSSVALNGAVTDSSGHTIFAPDTSVGLAYPFIALPLDRTFLPSNFSPSGSVQVFAQVPNTQIATERVLYQGRITSLIHPAIYIEGMWGGASIGDTSVYQFNVRAGSSLVVLNSGWSVNGTYLDSTHVFDLRPYVGLTGVPIQITAQQTTVGSSTNAAVQLLGAWLGATPAGPTYG